MSRTMKKVEKIAGLEVRSELIEDCSAPLLYLVHGRAGNFDLMWTFARPLRERFGIVAPQAAQPDPLGGYSWWQVAPRLEGLESALSSVQSFLEFLAEFEKIHNLKPALRLALGFSQGAGLLSLVMQAQPDLFAGIGLLAGFVIEHPARAFDGQSRIILPEIFMAHGNQDSIIPLERALKSKDLLESWGCEVAFYQDSVGHKVGTTGMRALKEWLISFA